MALPESLLRADWFLADRGYDANWFRESLADNGIKPCIPGRKSRKQPIKHNKRRTKRRHPIEMMFGRLKDWRRVITRLTTDVLLSSSRPSPWPPSSWSGYEMLQRGLHCALPITTCRLKSKLSPCDGAGWVSRNHWA